MSKTMILLDGEGLVQAVAKDAEEALEVIQAMADECEAGKSDRIEEAAELGFQFNIPPSQVYPLFRKARAARPAAVFSLPKAQPKVGALRFRPIRDPEPAKADAEAKAKAEARADASIKEAGKRGEKSIEARLVKELLSVFLDDRSEKRLTYNTQKKKVAEALGVWEMDVHRAVMAEVKAKEEKEAKPKLSQSQNAVALVLRDDIGFWIDKRSREAYAAVKVGEHFVNYLIGSGEFEDWLRTEYGQRHWIEHDGKRVPMPISANALHEGVAMIRAHALSTGIEVIPSKRVGGPDGGGSVWLDLGRSDWLLVKVTAEGWGLWSTGVPAVPFIRKKGMCELPVPVRGAGIQELRKLLHVSDEDFYLLVGWALACLRPRGPYPVLIVTGVAGSAKTSLCRVLAGLIDPNYSDVIPLGSADDTYIAAHNRYVLAFDNVSYVPQDLSDVLCRIATGTGYQKRQLYTDADQFTMWACKPIILNGIPDDLAERGDLADRAVVVELNAFDDDEQMGEEEFAEMFEEARPRLLGALLDGVAGALAGAKGINLEGWGRVRMMNAAQWAEAGCRALGFDEWAFLSAFVFNQERAMELAFRNDPVAQAVALLIEQNPGGWRGNTKPLLAALTKAVKKAKRSELMDGKLWPKSDNWLGKRLRRSAPVLRKLEGIEIRFGLDLRGEGGIDGGLEIVRRGAGYAG